MNEKFLKKMYEFVQSNKYDKSYGDFVASMQTNANFRNALFNAVKSKGYQGDSLSFVNAVGGVNPSIAKADESITEVKPSYTDEAKTNMREAALNSISKSYKGNFDTLLANKDKLRKVMADNQNKLDNLESYSTNIPAELITKIRNAEKALKLVNAYDKVSNLKSDEDFNMFLESTDESPYLTNAIVEAKYMRDLPSENIDIKEMIFPDASRSAKLGDNIAAIGLKGLFDVLETPMRAGIAGYKALETDDPNAFTREMARPTEYTGGLEQGLKSFVSPTGLITGAGKAAGRGVLRGAKYLPKLDVVTPLARGIGFLEKPADILGTAANVGNAPGALMQGIESGLRSVIKESPLIAAEAARYGSGIEGSDSDMKAILLGGGLGAFLPSFGKAAMNPESKIVGALERAELKDRLRTATAGLTFDELDEIGTSSTGADMLAGVKSKLDKVADDANIQKEQGLIDLDEYYKSDKDAWAKSFFGDVGSGKPRNIDALFKEAVYSNPTLSPSIKTKVLSNIEEVITDTDKLRETLKEYGASPIELSTFDKVKGPLNKKKVFNDIIDQLDEEYTADVLVQSEQLPEAARKKFEDDNLFTLERNVNDPNSLLNMAKARTAARKFGAGEGLVENRAAWQQTEDVIKDVQNKILETTPKGKEVQESYKTVAEALELKNKTLPDLDVPDKADAWLKKIGTRALDPGEHGAGLKEALDIQNQVRRVTGDNTIDWITPAVVRRVMNMNSPAKVATLLGINIRKAATLLDLVKSSMTQSILPKAAIAVTKRGFNEGMYNEEVDEKRTADLKELAEMFNRKTGRSVLAGQ